LANQNTAASKPPATPSATSWIGPYTPKPSVASYGYLPNSPPSGKTVLGTVSAAQTWRSPAQSLAYAALWTQQLSERVNKQFCTTSDHIQTGAAAASLLNQAPIKLNLEYDQYAMAQNVADMWLQKLGVEASLVLTEAGVYFQGIYYANVARGNIMLSNPTPYTIGNWLSMGYFDTAYNATHPETPFSPQHWIDSFVTVLGAYGAYSMVEGTVANSVVGTAPRLAIPSEAAIGIENTNINILDKLTRAQKRNVETLNNIINNNLKEHDFSGTLRDLQGDPVPKPGGGFWDHKTEMVQSYNSLQGIKQGLEGSLQNPNLDPEIQAFLQEELSKANSYINQIEELFKPYGGVK